MSYDGTCHYNACIQMERRRAIMNHGKSRPTAPHERGELFSSLSRVLDWWSDLGARTQRSAREVMAYPMLNQRNEVKRTINKIRLVDFLQMNNQPLFYHTYWAVPRGVCACNTPSPMDLRLRSCHVDSGQEAGSGVDESDNQGLWRPFGELCLTPGFPLF